jgi:hypothetical protein
MKSSEEIKSLQEQTKGLKHILVGKKGLQGSKGV